MPCNSTSRGVSGFTLIELLVVVVIAALLLVVAVPSFTDSFERNRIVSQANDVSAALSFARSEALRSNREVRICPADTALTACAANWDAAAWLVWRDDDGNNSLAASEILRVGQLSKKDSLAVVDDAGAALTLLSFDRRGRRGSPEDSPAIITMKPAECQSGKSLVRRFTVSETGLVFSSCIKCGSENSDPPTLCD